MNEFSHVRVDFLQSIPLMEEFEANEKASELAEAPLPLPKILPSIAPSSRSPTQDTIECPGQDIQQDDYNRCVL